MIIKKKDVKRPEKEKQAAAFGALKASKHLAQIGQVS